MAKVFISHASSDEPIVKSLIDDLLVGALAVKVREIFCSTTAGTNINSGEDWRNRIKKELLDSKVTILIITPSFKKSEVCLCEMGAAWVTSAKVLPFIVEPINYSSVGIIQQPNQIENLIDAKSLDRLKDIIQRELEIDSTEIKSDRWTDKKEDFLHKIKKYLVENPYSLPIRNDEVQTRTIARIEFDNKVRFLISKIKELFGMPDDLKTPIINEEISEKIDELQKMFLIVGRKFVLKKSNEKFMFYLKTGNGETILVSETYQEKASAVNGIASVKKNAVDDKNYDRLTSKSGQPYFVLKAGNGEVIGTSEMYSSNTAMENGIASVKENAPTAAIDDQS